jgi:dTDP-4-amino-4,6-dideoxygalactose transaminase
MYYILLPNLKGRTELIEKLKANNINTVFHYIPLHSAPAGLSYSRTHGELTQTSQLSECLLRLPLWLGLEDQQTRVIDAVIEALI